MIFNFSELSKSEIYFTMIQTLIPRPIAWVLTENSDSGYNLAPFSFFNGVSCDPPIVMISAGRKRDKSRKDTWRNIEERKHFVVHIPSVEHADEVTTSAADLPENTSEITRGNLQTTAFDGFVLPRLAHCKAAYGCSLEQIILFGEGSQAMILGRIHSLFVSDEIITQNGHIAISAEKLNPLARLGGFDYCSITPPFQKKP